MKFIRGPETSLDLVHVTLKNNRKGNKGVCCSLTTGTASNSFRGLFSLAMRKQKTLASYLNKVYVSKKT